MIKPASSSAGGGIWTGVGLGLREIGANTRRSLLSMLSICLGIATVLILNSLTSGARESSLKQMNRMGGVEILTVNAEQANTVEEEAAFARSEGLKYDEMENFIKGSQFSDALLPEGWYKENILKGVKGAKPAHAMAVSWLYFEQYNVLTDSYQEKPQRLKSLWESGENVCLLGERIAGELFGSSNAALGQSVEYAGVKLKVMGLVRGTSKMDWKRSLAYYPYRVYLKHFVGSSDKLASIKVRMKNSGNKTQAMRELRGYLIRSHRGVLDFSIQSADEQVAESQNASKALSLLGWIIAGMAIGVGGIGILNLMLATVTGRLREIGVRKALGASDSSILAQFLAESVTVAAMGTLLGLVLGAAPTWFLKGLLPITPSLGVNDYLLALALGWGTGLFAGIYPALKAAKLSPVEALRGGS